MAVSVVDERLAALLAEGKWAKARALLEKEIDRRPDDHWLLTQLGVTFYEQGRYTEALDRFLAARELVPDCPLTLWNLAGTLDALGMPSEAIRIYAWILRSDIDPEDDPCWESKEWTDSLKTDTVFRLGVSFRHLGSPRKADKCFREYLHLLSLGIKGSYSIEEVQRQAAPEREPTRKDRVDAAIHAVLETTRALSRKRKGPSASPPRIDARKLLSVRP